MYIVFEGIDGSGKSTQSKLLKDYLVSKGYDVELIVEPTDSDIGKLIRKLLQNPNARSDYMQKTFGLLFAADRMILMNKIQDLESENKIIISDRSFYSSLVYQEPYNWIKEINKFAKKPDLVLLLDMDLKTAVMRSQGTDEFENEEFLSSVKEKYLKLARNSSNFKIINGNNNLDEVSSNIKKVVDAVFNI
ncbi:dTMP kinase [Methanobrevibacter sp. 87.7]|uniref:dTMP kinase n=1 Tax=Methanobrevibacter sp. 87.7 TaxID=387957 RepID=UPI000B5031FC|nr:dTMP kinase [Methanobrevibacter sp. 87.7]OWT33219.1 dTMP kinase [Methanobrevibacter sp. 87.7]